MRFRPLILVTLFAILSCKKENNNLENKTEFRQEMREFVIGISKYAKAANPKFLIVPQNGIQLVSSNGDVNGQPNMAYLNAIDANGQEDLFYGYDDQETSTYIIHNIKI